MSTKITTGPRREGSSHVRCINRAARVIAVVGHENEAGLDFWRILLVDDGVRHAPIVGVVLNHDGRPPLGRRSGDTREVDDDHLTSRHDSP